jgi:hypothetical protein
MMILPLALFLILFLAFTYTCTPGFKQPWLQFE